MVNPKEKVIDPTGKLVHVKIITEDAGITHLYLNGKECLAREIAFQHKPNELPLLKVILPVESLELDDLMLVGVEYSFTVGLVDKVTAPAQALADNLNSALGLAGVGLSGYGLVVKPVQMRVDYENLTTAFGVLLGGKEEAEQRIEKLTTFAGQTPFTRDDIYKANRILQVYTGDALGDTDALGGVKMVGDIAAGVGEDFNSVATWVSRLYSAMEGGRPVGEMSAALQDMGAMGSAGREKLEALTDEIANGSKTINEAWPEAVIPLNPARRQSVLGLWAETGRLLGIGGSEAGWPVIPTSAAPVTAGGAAVEMGGVTVQITVQGSGGSPVDDIRANMEEIASRVAGVIADKVSPIFANMPTRA